MPTRQLVIAPTAKADLKDIYQYGQRQWGQNQAETYIENIKERLWDLTEQPMMGVDRSRLILGARSLTLKSHTLFYRVTTDSIEIIRVLHNRQDPQRLLK